MGVTSECGEQEAGVASGSGWNLWVWPLGGRRLRLFVLIASAIASADNNKAVVWAEISLELVAVAIRFIRKLLQVLEQKRWD